MKKRMVLILISVMLLIGALSIQVFAADADDLLGQTVYVSNRWITIRPQPTTASSSSQIPYMTEVKLVDRTTNSSSGGWYELEYDGDTRYVWIAAGTEVFTAEESTYHYTSDNQYRQAVLDLASEIFLEWDTTYVHGEADGTMNSKGEHMFDCSGFVSYALNTALQQWNPLYNAPSSAKEMAETEYLYNEGLDGEFYIEHIPLDEALPGDVLFFDITGDDGVIDHCGLYVGNHEFLHSSDYDWVSGVNIMTLNGYMDELVTVARYIPDEIHSAERTLYTTNNYTKLRSDNTSSYKTLKTFAKGEAVTLKYTNRFSYIYVESGDGLEGYVLASSLVPALTDFEITTEPKDASTTAGSDASFTVRASGDDLSYQWQYRTGYNAEWVNSTADGCKSAAVTVPVTADKDGYQYRCLVTDGEGYTLYTRFATLSVMGISRQPETVYAVSGDTASFTVGVNGSDLSYQWQYRTEPEGDWTNSGATGSKTPRVQVSATSGKDGYQYRCKITDAAGNVTYSDAAVLHVLKVTAQPVTQKVKTGTTAAFTVSASGGDLSYQWQYRTSSSGSWKKSGAEGNQTGELHVSATTGKSSYQYRCKITDGAGNVVYSKAVYLYVLGVKTQPSTRYAEAGDTVSFTVSASGYSKTYQWQYRTSSSGSWKKSTLSTSQSRTLKVTGTTGKDGYQYRCKITDGAGNVVYTKAVYFHVLGIKSQPVTQKVEAGTTAVFTVKATGNEVKYQWQYRTGSTASWKISGATGNKTATLKVSGTTGKSGYQYRCKITDSAGNVVYTKAVYLYVLGIKTHPADISVKVGESAKFTVSASGHSRTYQWQYRTSSSGSWKNSTISSAVKATLKFTASAGKDGYQYRCKITDSAGNVVYSDPALLTVS